jgi:hypothetical protein
VAVTTSEGTVPKVCTYINLGHRQYFREDRSSEQDANEALKVINTRLSYIQETLEDRVILSLAQSSRNIRLDLVRQLDSQPPQTRLLYT